MEDFISQIRVLIGDGEVRISEHGYDELSDDGLSVREVISGISEAQIVEEYPNFPKGPSILLLQRDSSGRPVHVVWGIPKGHKKPVVLVTAYRPNPERWDKSFLRRH